MDRQFKHPMLPQTTHDELARQNFVQSLKLHIARNISPGNKAIYEKVALPKFEQEHQRSPQNRSEIRLRHAKTTPLLLVECFAAHQPRNVMGCSQH